MELSQSKPKPALLPDQFMIANLKRFLSNMRAGGLWNPLWDEPRLERAISALENARVAIDEMQARIDELERDVNAMRGDLQQVMVEGRA